MSGFRIHIKKERKLRASSFSHKIDILKGQKSNFEKMLLFTLKNLIFHLCYFMFTVT